MKKKITAMLLAICCISSTWTVYADDFSSGSSEVEIEITEDEDEDADERDPEPVVSLRMRAIPLRDLIRTAIERGSDLMWERG